MSAALPESVFHLLIADADVTSSYGDWMTVCGEVVRSSALPSSCYAEGDEVGLGRDLRFCPECVREACRWSAEVDQVAAR